MKRVIHTLAIGALACGWIARAVAQTGPATGIDPADKHAWSENSGWLNAAPTNGGVVVHFDGTSGYLSGYAWSENLGWVKFGGNVPGPYGNDTAINWGVNIAPDGSLAGYAWAENAGWIKFGPEQGHARIDLLTGRFEGRAWGENIGWISFKGTSPWYNVRTLAWDTQAHGAPNWWLDHYRITEDDDEGDGVPAWAEYVADTDPTNAQSFFRIAAVSNSPSDTVYFASSARRYYTLQRCADPSDGLWSNTVDQTDIPGTGGTASLCDTNPAPHSVYRVEVRTGPPGL